MSLRLRRNLPLLLLLASLVAILMLGLGDQPIVAYSIERDAASDGQIIVDTQDEEMVTLIMNWVDTNASTSAPITITNSPAVTLAEPASASFFGESGDAPTAQPQRP